MAKVQNKYNIIANRYSDALIEVAKSGKLSFEEISKDLAFVEETIHSSVELSEFLNNPVISIEDKKDIINKLFEKNVNALILNFLKVIVDKERFLAFDEIISAYYVHLDEINKISRIQVVSAVDLTDDAKERLKLKLEKKLFKTVTLDWEINPEIIAGLIIKMGDNIIDTSMKHKLEDMSQSIAK